MKKLLLLSMMLLVLGACTSTQDAEMMSRDTETEWWQEAGDPTSEYWWVNGYEDSGESDSE